MKNLESDLRALLKGEHSSLSISFNEENGPNYQTVGEWVAEEHSGIKDDDWVAPGEKEKAIATNSIWTAHWYPDTPIGFYRVHASTLDALLDYVRQRAKP